MRFIYLLEDLIDYFPCFVASLLYLRPFSHMQPVCSSVDGATVGLDEAIICIGQQAAW